ncbi:hypothetical protein ACFL6C_12750, partial [Myxococcota bacterium]
SGAMLADPFDATGWSDLQVHIEAAFSTAAEAGDTIGVRACCSPNGNCLGANLIDSIYNSDDGGEDDWADRGPFPLDTATFDNCPNIQMGFSWVPSIGSNKMVHIDDGAISGWGSLSLPVADNGDGTYSVSFAACEPTTVDVTCTWSNGDGGNPSDQISVTFN